MEVPEAKISRKTLDNELSVSASNKSHNPGLRALLSISKNTAALEKEYTELLQIENNFDELNNYGLVIIEANTPIEVTAEWKAVLQKINIAVTGINDSLTSAKEQISKKEKDISPDLWKQLAYYMSALKDNSKNAADSGLTLLPEAIHPTWVKEYIKPETLLVESIITHVESFRVLLQMVEQYTPDELNTLTQIIVDHVPSNFTYEEAVEYQNDYYKALANFKNEFKNEKNLWDKFLDILAGGTHQLPSEGAMMERWLDGEEAE